MFFLNIKSFIVFIIYIVIQAFRNLLYVFNSVVDFFTFTLLHYINTDQMTDINKSACKKKNAQTTIDRNVISANWQSFLQNQKQEIPNLSSHRKEVKREVNGYYKALRTEKHSHGVNKSRNKNSTNKNIADMSENINNRSKDGTPVLTRYVAMDCEMVGIGDKGLDNMLARVSLVNKFGDCIYDKFVQPRERVVDYRTPVSGVRKEDLLNGDPFETVQKEVSEILKGRYLVGHAIKNDLDVLFLSHPIAKIRDTSRYRPFKMITKGRLPSLKRLSEALLGVDIQKGEHSSVEDARATMQLYCLHAHNWEEMLKKKRQRKHNNINLGKS